MTYQTTNDLYAGSGAAHSAPAPGPDDQTAIMDKAADSAQAGKQAVGEMAQTAAGQAKEVAHEAQTQARNVLGEARDQLSAHADDQHRNAVTNLRSLSDELRAMANASTEGGVATGLVSQASERAHDAADWLDQRQPGDLVAELRSFARRRPGAFLAGALVAGVIAGRLTRGAVAAHTDDNDTASSPSSDGHDTSPVVEYAVVGGEFTAPIPEYTAPYTAAGGEYTAPGGQYTDPAGAVNPLGNGTGANPATPESRR